MHSNLLSLNSILFLLAPLLMLSDLHAQIAPPDISQAVTTKETQALGEKLEHLGRLHSDESNETLQELWILGRYHGQYHWSEGSVAEDDSYETRRMRLGAQARLFKKLTLHAQMVSGTNVNPFYNGFTELWTQWAFSPEFALTVGQQKHRFTHDRNVSSRYINYLERAMLTNMFALDYTPAVTAQGKIDRLNYYGGVFSNATGTNMGDAFTELDSGYSVLGAVYYDFGSWNDLDDITCYLSYVHSDANQNATNLSRFDDGISSALIITNGHSSWVTEITAGVGSDSGNAIGVNFQPGYFLTDNLQFAGRYQLASSNNDDGLQPQRRYEKPAGLANGDLYQATYAGVNYYIAKHRLKLMNGVEYSSLGGQDVWTFSTMVRFFFGPQSGGAFPMNQMLPGKFHHD